MHVSRGDESLGLCCFDGAVGEVAEFAPLLHPRHKPLLSAHFSVMERHGGRTGDRSEPEFQLAAIGVG